MKTSIRKIGNSAGAILPAAMLKNLNLREGDAITVREEGSRIVIERAVTRPRYKLADLVAQCDLTAAPSAELLEWENAPMAGEELL